MDTFIYTNARASGKTRWLVEQYIKERRAGNYCVFLGNRAKRYRFVEKVFAEGFSYLEGLPKIDDGSHRTLCFFTDELDTEIGTENLCVDEYHLANARWYITIDNSCFAVGSHL